MDVAFRQLVDISNYLSGLRYQCPIPSLEDLHSSLPTCKLSETKNSDRRLERDPNQSMLLIRRRGFSSIIAEPKETLYIN